MNSLLKDICNRKKKRNRGVKIKMFNKITSKIIRK